MSHENFKNFGSPLIRLIEECAELQMALTKAERFGMFNHHPERTQTNFDDIRREMDDVVEAIERMQASMRLIAAGHYGLPDEELP